MLTSNKAVYGVDGSLGTLGNRGGSSGGLTPSTQVNIPGEDPVDLDEYIESIAETIVQTDNGWNWAEFESTHSIWHALSTNRLYLPDDLIDILEDSDSEYTEIYICLRLSDGLHTEGNNVLSNVIIPLHILKQYEDCKMPISTYIYQAEEYRYINFIIHMILGETMAVNIEGLETIGMASVYICFGYR